MCNSFYKIHNEVLKFDIDKDIDLIRFNHWIMKKENISRVGGNIDRGTFEMTVRIIEKDLGISFQRARTIIKKFEELGIIELVKKSKNRHEASVYAYTTTYENGEKINTVNNTVNNTKEASDCNTSSSINNTVNNTVNNTSKKENKKENKKDIYIVAFTEIFDIWNNGKIIVHKKQTDLMVKAYKSALNNYTHEEIKEAIENYSRVIASDFYYSYKFSLDKFLTQKNAISRFVGKDGDVYINYLEANKKGPIAVGPHENKKTNYTPSICKKDDIYSKFKGEFL